jgi:hypothetical protein
MNVQPSACSIHAEAITSDYRRRLADALPILALVLFLVSAVYAPLLPHVLQHLPDPAVLAMALWCLLGQSRLRPSLGLTFLILLHIGLVAWLVLSFHSSIDPVVSRQWVLAFTFAYVVPFILAARGHICHTPSLERALLASGIIIGVFSIFENLFSYNPFTAEYLRTANGLPIQHWAVYRSETTLGHPLVAGTFLSTVATYAIVRSQKSYGRARRYLWCVSAVAAAGTFVTVSRSSLIALGVAITLGIGLPMLRNPGTLWKIIPFAGGGLVILLTVVSSGLVEARSSSAEGQASEGYRGSVISLAHQLGHYTHGLGSGPGTSQIFAERFGVSTLLEDSAAQVYVSVGLVGLLLVTLSIISLSIVSLRSKNISAASAILCLIINSLAFDLWETDLTVFVLLGILSILAAGEQQDANRVFAPRRLRHHDRRLQGARAAYGTSGYFHVRLPRIIR